jgi:hypothetical protein
MSDARQPAPRRAIRLIFEYEGDEVRLVTQQPVEMAITGFDIAQVERPGYYVDARDADGQTLARVPARNAFAASTEVFPEQPGEPITRIDVPEPPGAYTVVVPVPERADHVAVTRVAPGTPGAPRPGTLATSPVPGSPEVTDVATFPLDSSQ